MYICVFLGLGIHKNQYDICIFVTISLVKITKNPMNQEFLGFSYTSFRIFTIKGGHGIFCIHIFTIKLNLAFCGPILLF